MPTVFITGATGFIGRALCVKMLENGWKVKGTFRKESEADILPAGVKGVQLNLNENRDFCDKYFAGVDVVVHLAARVHIMKDSDIDAVESFSEVNVAGTKRLADIAAKCGVHRLVFISSIGVNGEFSLGMPFREEDIPNPQSAYAVSKWNAEQVLHAISKASGMEVVILRPPLVYGPAAPGNFSRLMRLIKIGLPLPLGNMKNLRSFVYIGNLVDAVIISATHPRAAGETFIVSDGQDISTSDLIKKLAFALKKNIFLFSIQPVILRTLCKIVGKGKELEKLTGPLRVDSSKIKNLLGWKPRFLVEEGIAETARFYKDMKHEKGV